jgi:hypothetical protein
VRTLIEWAWAFAQPRLRNDVLHLHNLRDEANRRIGRASWPSVSRARNAPAQLVHMTGRPGSYESGSRTLSLCMANGTVIDGARLRPRAQNHARISL